MRRATPLLAIVIVLSVAWPPWLATIGEARAVPRCFGHSATIIGTHSADVLTGTPNRDVIDGLGGDDTIRGRGADDLLCGGSGNDKLYGGPDYDRIRGGDGNDQLFSQGGNDDLWGQAGNDTLNGAGSGTNDWALFADAPNGVNADLSTGRASGEGTDTLIGIEGLVGSKYDDTLVGDEKPNAFDGQGGNDTIDGGDGIQDVVMYLWAKGPVTVDLTAGTATAGGTDTLIGVEWVYGGSSNDTITGDANPNFIWGGGGNDTISGLDGDDTIFGQDGDDTIDAGGGADIVHGGPGTDTCTNGEDVGECEP